MANIHDCLQRAVDAGELDQVRADEAKSEFDQLVERFSQAMPRHQAEQTAAVTLKEASRKSQRSRRHAVLNQLQSMVRLKTLIEQSDTPWLAIRSLVEQNERSDFTGESVESMSRAMERWVNGQLNQVARATGRNLIGNSRDKALLNDVIRELHLEDTGNGAAKTMATAVAKVQQRLRQMFNAHGGDIGDLADFGVSHSHDVMRMRRAGFDAWSEAVFPRIDWNRIVNTRTGEPFAAAGQAPSRADADAFLTEVWEGITKRGWHKQDPSMAVGGKAMYNRRAEARVLHFKSGSDWLEYNREFGTSDPFTAMTAGLQGLARDVAMMRVLGPNPRLGLEYAVQVAEDKVAGNIGRKSTIGLEPEVAVRQAGALARTTLAHIDGSANNTYREGWARFFSNVGQVVTSSKLGSAILSAPSDLVFTTTAAQIVGMNPGNVLSRAVQLAASGATRKQAARMGYVAETLTTTGAAAARFTGETISSEWASRITDFTIRASGLSYWTDMLKLAFQMEFAGFLADNAPRAFDQIDDPLRRILQRRGISAADWDLLRTPETMFKPDADADFLSPFHWLEHQTTLPRVEAEGLALRLQMAIEEQMEFAVPSVRKEARAAIIGNTEPGTIGGEVMRSAAKFTNFSTSTTIGMIQRFMSMPTPMALGKYLATMAVMMPVLGALSVQLKEIRKGNDPRPMFGEGGLAFWKAAVLQAGGLGIFGDFLTSAESRFGKGLAETVAGPNLGLLADIATPIASNLNRLTEGQDTLIGRDIANFLRFNTPALSSLTAGGFVPVSLAFQRLGVDQLQLFLDPEAEALWRRQERRRERDFGSGIWWERAAPAPSRAPDISNAFEGAAP